MTWPKEPHRHSLSSRGIKTTYPRGLTPSEKNIFKLNEFNPPFLYDFVGPFPDTRYETKLEYQQKEKNRTAKIIWMTPTEYIQAIDRGFRAQRTISNQYDINIRIHKENLQKVESIMEKGPVYMPYLQYDVYYYNGRAERCFSQEGHHRVVAASELGAKQIPVFIIYPYSKNAVSKVEGLMTSTVKQKLKVTK